MAVLIRPKRWGPSKPTPGATVDFGHSLAKDLAGAWLLDGIGTPTDLVSRVKATVSGLGSSNGQISSSPFLGGSAQLHAATSQAAKTTVRPAGSPILSGKPTWTVWARVGGLVSVGVNGCWLYQERPTTGNDFVALGLTGTTSPGVRVTYRNDGGTLLNTTFTAGTFLDGPHSAAMTFDGAKVTAFRDGKNLGNTAWASNNTLTNAGIASLIGGDTTDANNWADGLCIAAVYVWTRALTVDELHLLETQPYAFIAPQAPRQRWVNAVSSTVSGTATLTGSGSLTAAGAPAFPVPAGFSGSGTLAASGTPTPTATPGLSGSGSLTAAGLPALTGAAVLTGDGVLTALATLVTTAGIATLSGAGTLTTAAVPATSGSVGFTGAGQLAVGGAPGFVQLAYLTGDGVLTAVGRVVAANVRGYSSLTVTARGASTNGARQVGSAATSVHTVGSSIGGVS